MAIYVNKEKAKFYLSTPDDPNKWFYLKDGRVLKNIYDLLDYTFKCSEDDYTQYQNEERKDFYNWILNVFSNERLAKSVKKARTAREANMFLDRNIKMLERNAKN